METQPTWPPKTPALTVDVIVRDAEARIALIARRNPPLGWALPGGFVELDESTETAARREILEELGVEVDLEVLLGVYSNPGRDPRFPVASVVYVGRTAQPLQAGSDAKEARFAPLGEALRLPLAFDHETLLKDYAAWDATGVLPAPRSGVPS